jgi:stage II sporulation protein AA (anti-sigma F factor antagonist)
MKLTVERRGDLIVVCPEGQIVRENQGQLRAPLEEALADGVTRIAIDLKGVDYMDSAGLGCCSALQKRLEQHPAGRMAVFGASLEVQKTWQLIRLDLVIPLFPDEAGAVAWVCGRA